MNTNPLLWLWKNCSRPLTITDHIWKFHGYRFWQNALERWWWHAVPSVDSRFLLCSQKTVGGTQSCGKNYLQSTWGGAVVRMCQKDFLSLCHAGFVCNCFVNQTQNCFHLQNTKLTIRRKDIIKDSGRTLWLGRPSWRRRKVPAMCQYLYHQQGTHVTSSMTAHLGRLSLLFLVCLRITRDLILYLF